MDPHFGTREEFRDFVRAAREQGMYVILDIIARHTWNVFTYAGIGTRRTTRPAPYYERRRGGCNSLPCRKFWSPAGAVAVAPLS